MTAFLDEDSSALKLCRPSSATLSLLQCQRDHLVGIPLLRGIYTHECDREIVVDRKIWVISLNTDAFVPSEINVPST